MRDSIHGYNPARLASYTDDPAPLPCIRQTNPRRVCRRVGSILAPLPSYPS